ncbi:TRAP transporter substrate-binding protein DctP [Agrococcus carbonis]|nr:TRAP transporter substrate-binding protein DctP [Agrococcus carbonis]
MHTNQPARIGAILTALLLTTGCAASGSAPGAVPSPSAAPPADPSPVALRLGFVAGLADAEVEALQDALPAATDGRVTIDVASEFDSQALGVEQRIVRGVADGAIDLGLVGARAFRELGVRDFDALIAPMVLDSVEAQRAVLASDLPDAMLAGVEPLGVEGLAVLAGPIRRPIADAPLHTLADFDGISFYSWHGDINAMSIEALGAVNVDASPSERNARIADGSIRAYENSLAFLARNADWRARTMTVDLGLWPSTAVLIADGDALEALGEDREAVLRAIAAVADDALDRADDEQALAAEACSAGASLALAGDDAVREIERAFEPVLGALRADAVVADHLDAIATLTDGIEAARIDIATCEDAAAPATPDPASSPEPGAGPGSAGPDAAAAGLDGTYAVEWEVADLAAALGGDDNPESAEVARGNAGELRLTLDRGRYDLLHVPSGDSCPGTYAIDGDRLVMTATSRPSEWHCGAGLGEVAVDAAWAVEGDRLTLTDWRVPQPFSMLGFNAVLLGTLPLERVGAE